MAPLDLEAAPLAELPAWLKSRAREVREAALVAAGTALAIAARQDKGDPLGLYEGNQAPEALGEALRRELRKVAPSVAEHGAEGLACYLEGLGPKGQLAARRTRKDGAELTVARALARLALVLWWESVRADCEKDAIGRYPGVPLPVVERNRVGTWGKSRAVDTPGHGRVLVDGGGITVATLDPERVPSVPAGLLEKLEAWERNGAKLLGSLHAHRLIRWLAWQAHTRHVPEHSPILEVEGGWQALALEVGCHSKKAADKLRDIVWCLDAHRFAFPDGSVGRLLTVHSYRLARGNGNRAAVSLLPGAPLLPGFLFRLRKPEQKIVPVLEALPPMVGWEGYHGALAELHWRVLVDMRRRCREMVGGSPGVDVGLPLAPRDWRRLADEAQVPGRVLAEALERWTQDGSDGPAFLRQLDGDRFTLAPAHEAPRRVLLHYGWKEAKGSEDGKKSARSRGNAGPKRRRRGRG